MSNEQEITAIAKTLARAGLLSEHYNKSVAKVLVEAGYLKADGVRKETIKEVLYAVDDEARGTTSEVTRVLRRRYGVEVDE